MLDLSKKYKTRDGKAVVSIHHLQWTDEERPLIVEIMDWDEFVYTSRYHADGKFFKDSVSEHAEDLIEIKPHVEPEERIDRFKEFLKVWDQIDKIEERQQCLAKGWPEGTVLGISCPCPLCTFR